MSLANRIAEDPREVGLDPVKVEALFQRAELPPLFFTIYAQHSAQVLTL